MALFVLSATLSQARFGRAQAPQSPVAYRSSFVCITSQARGTARGAVKVPPLCAVVLPCGMCAKTRSYQSKAISVFRGTKVFEVHALFFEYKCLHLALSSQMSLSSSETNSKAHRFLQ